MRRGIRIFMVGALIAAAGVAASAATWTADFTPSTWNPAVGEIVQFSVCESCHGAGTYVYLWDFNSDGVVDTETSSPMASFVCSGEGFYAVKLTVRDAGGRTQTRTKGILAGAIPAYGLRQIAIEADGAALVSITIRVTSSAVALGVEEPIPAGWQAEVIDAAGSLWTYNADKRQLEVVWMSQVQAGDEIVFTYRLYSNYASQLKQLSGAVTGYHTTDSGGQQRFNGQICGEQYVP